ncbi:hypothetical protein GTO91_16670 [Heliobacterium undosum]|uniref:DUF5412 domain-containing protein n=1 Tax=Heliomicrobium undosum TaxID=121734 RepID=A0A845L6L1_9FIRM|nr:DUF5412 family protein [Heliomicrobium undosum]MZP31336.1 hypothetical protein [Heliomicrobium undosum]
MTLEESRQIRAELRRKLAIGCLLPMVIVAVLLLTFGYIMFFTLRLLPEGHYMTETQSPDKSYTIRFYICDDDPLSADSIRGELMNNQTNVKKNIYWEYRFRELHVDWIDNDTVLINGHRLRLPGDTYDWRRDSE